MEMEEADGEISNHNKFEEKKIKQDVIAQELNGATSDTGSQGNPEENGPVITTVSTVSEHGGDDDVLDLMESDVCESENTGDSGMEKVNKNGDDADNNQGQNNQDRLNDSIGQLNNLEGDNGKLVADKDEDILDLNEDVISGEASEGVPVVEFPDKDVNASTNQTVSITNAMPSSSELTLEAVNSQNYTSHQAADPVPGQDSLPITSEVSSSTSTDNIDPTSYNTPVIPEVTSGDVNSEQDDGQDSVTSQPVHVTSNTDTKTSLDASPVDNNRESGSVPIISNVTSEASPDIDGLMPDPDVTAGSSDAQLGGETSNLVITDVTQINDPTSDGDSSPAITVQPEKQSEDTTEKEEGMEITDEMENNLLNNDMEDEPEVNDKMEVETETKSADEETVEMEKLEENSEDAVMETLDSVKDEEMTNIIVNEADMSMEMAEEKGETTISDENKETTVTKEKAKTNVSNEDLVTVVSDEEKDTTVSKEEKETANAEEKTADEQNSQISDDVKLAENENLSVESETKTSEKEESFILEENTSLSDETSVAEESSKTDTTIKQEKETLENKEENQEKSNTQENQTLEVSKSEESSVSEVSVIKPKEDDDDVQIIDLDADSDPESSKPIKKETNETSSSGLGIQIMSVSGATDINDVVKKETVNEVKTEQKDLKKEDAKAVVPVKQEVKQEVKADTKATPKSKIQTCIVCKKTGKCKYNIVRNGDIKHLCDDDCFKRFRSSPTTFLRSNSPAQPQETSKTIAPVSNQQGQYKTCQVCQIMNINASSSKPFLNWQGMDFCGEDCLGKFQSSLNTSCSICTNVIQQATKGKFCLKSGNQLRQFCSQNCYAEFIKRQKLCECCQNDISKSTDAFVAPAGPDGSFKDFCSQNCLQKYEEKNNRDIEITGVEQGKKGGVVPKGTHTCSVCSKVSTMKHQVQLEGKTNFLCSDPCFSAFQYANKLTMNTCDNCGVYCYNEGMNPQYIQFEGQQKRFCSFMCVNTFKTLNKKVVSCSWCNCKKSNFDMIERVDANNKYQLFCSLNCLSLYRVNLQATSNQAVMCDQCKRYVPAQYHLTMSDASVRNFCSYNCVMNFQSQFTGTSTQAQQPTTAAQKAGIATRSTNRPQQPPQKALPQTAVKSTATQQAGPRPPVQNRPTNPNMNSIPIISNVVSLAPQGNQQQQVNFKSNQQVPLVINNKNTSIRTTVPAQTANMPVQTVIIQPPQPKMIKNKSCLCKPFVQTKATSCRPHTQTKETQTDKDMEPQSSIIPIPIPFYVPVPMAMYSQPLPTPFAFPVPIPIPCFIPTTKKSTSSILKQIKEIREKIPDDPLEAELLMMAEAVSAVAKDSSESESDNEADMEPVEDTTAAQITSTSRSASPEPEPTEKPAELGEDMLQMALRMATEITSEPVMDLEETIEPVPVNTEPPQKQKPAADDDEDEDLDDDEEYKPVRETRSKNKGQKRPSSGHSRRRSKRQKTPVVKVVDSPAPDENSSVSEPPPDAHLSLKYTYGVNAWKHWVVQKNNQLDKVSKQGSGKLKLFKTDMLQCSADELNYSLCLFVKEVRKPNGEEYAPDSIYYLCIGIQMFLFENERIDNIFTDIYYEKFTECLNEVLQRYTPKLNAAGQIVCRIEEEHLWECKQLGAHSPHVLLNTLVYFNTKFFQLKTPEDHLKLSFTHIMKHWKKTAPGKGNTQGRSVYLRYYCPAPIKPVIEGSRKKKEELPVYEQCENLDNPLRCPVKLYEFYLSKCPESIKNRSDAFYLVPERSCVPDSPVWYSTQNLQIEAMNKMLHRTMLVREIQESFIHIQPIYA